MNEQLTTQFLIDKGFSSYRAERMLELMDSLTAEGFKCVAEGMEALHGGRLVVAKPAGVGLFPEGDTLKEETFYYLIASVSLHDGSYGHKMGFFEAAVYNEEGELAELDGFFTKNDVIALVKERSRRLCEEF